MIYIDNLTKSYGQRNLFANLSLTINRGEKVGLIGPNGSGKSTLFSIILSKLEPSLGGVRIDKNVRIGYLPQEASFTSKATVISEATEGDETIKHLLKEKDKLEANYKTASGRYGEVLHELEFLGYFELEHKAKKVLTGLGFKDSDFNRPINHLSSGWQMRTLLGRLLTCRYDILLLDEPTNYLDLGAALWFKDYLANFNESFIMISHDLDFLNEVTNYTLVLENSLMTKVKGNYQDYQKMMEQRRNFLLKQSKEQEKKREQLQQFIYRFHGQPNKASQVRAKRKILERMDEIQVPLNRRESIRNFHFPQTRQSGQQVIRLEKISKAYGDIQVYKDFDFEISKGEKAVLAGANGAGKSTLLKILAEVIDIDSGRRIPGYNVDTGYFSQTRMDVLSPYNTVFEEVYTAASGNLNPEGVRTILGAFLFSGDDVEKKVSILSGGEKSRLILAKLLANSPNFLLLDEPTTHLDVDAVDALIKALTEYTGTLVFISHDIHFVRSVANVVYEVKAGRVRKFPGHFDYYWERAKEKGFVKDTGVNTKGKSAWISDKQKKAQERQKLKQQKEHNAGISKKIRALRKEKEALELDRNVKARVLSNPRSYHNKETVIEYGRSLKNIEKRLSEIDKEVKELKTGFITDK